MPQAHDYGHRNNVDPNDFVYGEEDKIAQCVECPTEVVRCPDCDVLIPNGKLHTHSGLKRDYFGFSSNLEGNSGR
jgi:hypothetical protein